MRGTFYTTSEKAWEAMLAAIVGAKESIYLEMYIFDGDTEGYDFLAELEVQARRGLRVILILDALGSFALAAAAIERLKRVGVEVLFFSYWLRRTHRKILIIDEHLVFLGGVNISGKFAQWKDLQVAVSGRIAHLAVESFARVYRECNGKNPALIGRGTPRLWRRTRTWFLESGVHKSFHTLHTHYATHIDNAARSLVLVTPYLIPRHWMVSHLHQAVLRGVAVTIIIPKQTEYAFMDRINYFYADQFEKIGVRCLLSTEMNHAKAMLVDEHIGTIGSQNFDTLSFNWNVESGMFFNDHKMVQELSAIIDEWRKEAEEFTTLKYAPRWYDFCVAYILRLLEGTL